MAGFFSELLGVSQLAGADRRGGNGPPPHSGGNGFGSGGGKGKKRAKGDFRSLQLSSQTHRSSTDRKARLFRKSNSTGAYLRSLGHCLMENRHGLVVAREVTPADGYGERAVAARMARLVPGAHQKTLEADKGDDIRDVVVDLRISGITPHGTQNIQNRRRSAMDGHTVHHSGCGQSINARKRIEQAFGWIKQAVGLAAQGPGAIKGRSGVPPACGGLQPDSPGGEEQTGSRYNRLDAVAHGRRSSRQGARSLFGCNFSSLLGPSRPGLVA